MGIGRKIDYLRELTIFSREKQKRPTNFFCQNKKVLNLASSKKQPLKYGSDYKYVKYAEKFKNLPGT
jgi:hypothetical protein